MTLNSYNQIHKIMTEEELLLGFSDFEAGKKVMKTNDM
jgi:hypothetical protein